MVVRYFLFDLHPGECVSPEALLSDHFWVCFGSILHGDLAGVGTAISAQERWLQRHGFLDDSSRLTAARGCDPTLFC